MLFKLIIATVPSSLRAEFTASQTAAWSGLGSVPGFLAQGGGWETNHPDWAIVIAYWKNEQSYADFMRQQHDSFADQQRETYSQLQVYSGHVIMNMKEADPRILMNEAEIVRVTDLTLLPDSSPMFLAMQFDVWRPALAGASGILGNTVARLARLPDRFASTTFWRSTDALRNFLENLYPALSAQANLEKHIKERVSYHARLEPSWRVLA
jgi:heme-degrading monooxygenase HmoA